MSMYVESRFVPVCTVLTLVLYDLPPRPERGPPLSPAGAGLVVVPEAHANSALAEGAVGGREHPDGGNLYKKQNYGNF